MPSIAELFVNIGADTSGLTRGLSGVQSSLSRAQNSLQSAGGALSGTVTAPVAAAGAAVIGFGVEWENAFANVRRTVGKGVDLGALNKGLRELATSEAGGGKTAAELANIATTAAKVGIAGDDLLSFTKVVAQFALATDMSVEQAGEGLARIAKLTGVDPSEYENLASAIAEVGDSFGGTEQDILETTKRISGALTAVGVSAQDQIGIAAALADVGINPEAGGTAISTFFLDMQKAASGTNEITDAQAKKMQNLRDRIQDMSGSLAEAQARQQQFGRNTPAATVQANADAISRYQRELGQAKQELQALAGAAGGGTKIAGFAKVAGVSADEMTALIKSNPAQAFQLVVDGLGRIKREGGDTSAALEAIGATESRQIQTLLQLANTQGVLERAIATSNEAWGENTKIQEDAAIQAERTEVKWNILMNKLKEEAIATFEAIQPLLSDFFAVVNRDIIPAIQGMVAQFKAMSPEEQANLLKIVGVAAALGPALVIIASIVGLIGLLASGIGLVIVAVALLGAAWATNFGGIQDKTKMLGDTMNAIGEKFATEGAGGVIGPAAADLGTRAGGLVDQWRNVLAAESLGSGGGGTGGFRPDVTVNINNPTVPDQTTAERFAQQVQEQVISALIQSEQASEAPPPILPGNPFGSLGPA